jgi:acyl-CoA synthetase (AMP-forming)/AMP-acid ligase II
VSTLADVLDDSASRHAGADALRWNGQRLSYAQLHALVWQCSDALRRAGVEHRDRVAMLAPPCWQQVAVFLAAAHAGAIFVGLNPRHRFAELDYVVGDSRPVLLFCAATLPGADASATREHLLARHASIRRAITVDCSAPEDPGFADFVGEGDPDAGPPDARPEDAVAVIYTSGSTGARKGALLSHRGLLMQLTGFLERLPLTHPIHCLVDVPVDHIAGLVERVMPPLMTGGHVVLHERFDPVRFLSDAVEHRVNFIQGEITQWLRCVDLPEFGQLDFSAVEVCNFAGAAAPPALVRILCERFPAAITGWGMSETSGGIVVTDPVAPEMLAGMVGRPITGAEMAISPEGEILVRGPLIMPGYLGRPPEVWGIDVDGWLHTGDIGEFLPDGNLRLLGRRSDMYKSGGFNVYPREVEVVLESHPGVAHAVVVAVPDDERQEVGIAFVVGTGDVTAEALAAHCRDQLAGYKQPERLELVPELPLLANGKVDKRTLRAVAAEA